MDGEQKYLTGFEVSQMLRLDYKRVRFLVRKGRIPGGFLLPSGEVRFDKAVLEAWLAEQAESTGATKGGAV